MVAIKLVTFLLYLYTIIKVLDLNLHHESGYSCVLNSQTVFAFSSRNYNDVPQIFFTPSKTVILNVYYCLWLCSIVVGKSVINCYCSFLFSHEHDEEKCVF